MSAMPITPEAKRSQLVIALKNSPEHMQERLREIKLEARGLRQLPDLLWYLLLQTAATQGNSRGWDGLCGDPDTFQSVAYPVLARLIPRAREEQLLNALRRAVVRMPARKTRWLVHNFTRVHQMGGVEKATQHMLSLSTRDDKLRFMKSFDGIGEKYGRNNWMVIYDPDFRDTVAVDERLKKVAKAIDFRINSYQHAEEFYIAIAREAGLEPWELDRLLYNFTDHFLNAVEYTEPEPHARHCR